MCIKLYHCRDARSLRPLWALEELNLDYDLVLMPFPPRFKYPNYLEINPLGTVPTLIDGSLTMTESTAMCQYVVEKYAADSPLGVRLDEPDYGAYLNWLHRGDTTLTFPQALILRYSIFEKPERRVPQVVDDYARWFLSRLGCVEDALQKNDFLCADRFTIADIAVGYALYLASHFKATQGFGPRTAAYLERLQGRPAFQRCLDFQADLDSIF